jgi:Uma2 family endonuclease
MRKIDPSLSDRPTVRDGRGVVRYPESDGKPMGETGVHVNVIFLALELLRRHYGVNSRVAVLSNMFLYYEEGDPRKVVCPDLFVVPGVPRNTMRRTYKLWIEGKAPEAVIEFTSKKTRKEDMGRKFELYRDVLRVREYFLFDPLGEYLEPSLQGFRLVEERYVPIDWDGSGLFCEVLGLRLERDESDLRFFDPMKGKRVPTGQELEVAAREAEAARVDAEAARGREAEARMAAQAEVERLRREMDDLRGRLAGDDR